MLSPSAHNLISNYLNLPCVGIAGVRCPYFNNARHKRRGELRALIGKGSPEEIIAEAHIVSMQYKANLFDTNHHQCLCATHSDKQHTADDIRHFLIDHGLGIECSGFVTHVLAAHFKETKKIDFPRSLFITSKKHIFRYLISRLRPIENCDVTVYTNDRNTRVVASDDAAGWDYARVQAGDCITILRTGPRKTRNHIILITEASPTLMRYVHARAWPSEGEYGHGVAEGEITITNPGKPLRDQTFTECGITGEKNETWREIADGECVEVRRSVII